MILRAWSRITFELRYLRVFLTEVFCHPSEYSYISVNTERREISVQRH